MSPKSRGSVYQGCVHILSECVALYDAVYPDVSR